MLRLFLPILILLAALGGFFWLKASAPEHLAVAARERVWQVAVTTTSPASHAPTLSLYGQVEAPDMIRATAPVAGRLAEVRVRDGEQVERGQILAKLDARDMRPRLLRARAQLEQELERHGHDLTALKQEQALLELARTAFKRASEVKARQLGSSASVDQAREALLRAELAVTVREQSLATHPARLTELQANLAEAERDLERGTIRAPFAARIATVSAAAGDQVQPNQIILTLYPATALYVRAKIPGAYSEELLAALSEGQKLAASGQFSGQPIAATLERVAGEADPRGVDALLRLTPNSHPPLGALLDLQLARPAQPDTIALPFSALHGGQRIFVVTNGRLRGILVKRVGQRAGNGAGNGQVILHAPTLPPGAPVMTTHLPNAIDGLKVEIVP